jgi:hypothetical protein
MTSDIEEDSNSSSSCFDSDDEEYRNTPLYSTLEPIVLVELSNQEKHNKRDNWERHKRPGQYANNYREQHLRFDRDKMVRIKEAKKIVTWAEDGEWTLCWDIRIPVPGQNWKSDIQGATEKWDAEAVPIADGVIAGKGGSNDEAVAPGQKEKLYNLDFTENAEDATSKHQPSAKSSVPKITEG